MRPTRPAPDAENRRPRAPGATLSSLPLVGRSDEMGALVAALEAAGAGRGSTVILRGESGVGKTRLATTLSEQAARRGWSVSVGRAYAVESGVPYALFSDALLPTLRQLDPSTLTLLTRGGSAELAYLFPALSPPQDRDRSPGRGDPADFKARLLWNFSQFLSRFAARQPLLVVLENLQWADSASIELLHFVARQVGGERILLLCTYNDAERDQNPALRAMEPSLTSLGVATVLRLTPLTREHTDELVNRVFNAERSATRDFTSLLYSWTCGNPFFVEETLKTLVESGRLFQREGTWLGWELEELNLPRSIRDALVARIDRLTPAARSVANLAAVMGARASYEALRSVSALPEPELLAVLDELRRQGVLLESSERDSIVYDFTHPMLQDTLYSQLGLARARLLHATVAEALEAHFGVRAVEQADVLAFHFARADVRGLAPKAVRYLSAAGRAALAKSANREAANYLQAALELHDRDGGAEADAGTLAEDLARTRQRLGDYEGAISLWARARLEAERAGDFDRLAAIERRTGLACYWSGRYGDALAHYGAGLTAARGADPTLHARLQIAKGMCLLELGRLAEAQREVDAALDAAERSGDASLLARAHRALMLLHVWTGPPGLAREHGAKAIALAAQSGERTVGWQSHWAMATLEGLNGNAAAIARHLSESERLADELRSPLLRLWTAEISIEYGSGTGDWDAALALGERTIALARTLSQRTLLPRLLVWTGLIYLGRGDLERAKRYLDEAWHLSGADRDVERAVDVHTVVPAHAGRAAYFLAIGDYRHAIRTGEDGLRIADRTGYVAWAIHRLLPIIGEAALWLGDFERAEQHSARMRRDAQRLGHLLGLAWADGCDGAIVLFRDRDPERASSMLRRAAEDLEAIPFPEYGARVRRQLASALADLGDREGAARELRRAHEALVRLGAERELSAVREQLREIGARPPARSTGNAAAGLTGREVEIVRLVGARKSNKEIGAALGISPRTVSTHLSNIFGKLSVGTRGELTDLVRERGLPETGATE